MSMDENFVITLHMHRFQLFKQSKHFI